MSDPNDGNEKAIAEFRANDRIYGGQAQRFPGFAGYERQTAGIRTIPVFQLTRA